MGGAERFLGRLAGQLAKRYDVDQLIVSIDPIGERSLISNFDEIPVISLEATSVRNFARAMTRLRHVVAEFRPDIIQTWLYRADLTGALARSAAPQARLVWNLRCSDAPLHWKSQLLVRLAAHMSWRLPDAIIACGYKARDHHVSCGYDLGKISIINNGFDFGSLPTTLPHGKCDDMFILGAAGRWDPAKNYDLLFDVFSDLRAGGVSARLIVAGFGCSYDNPEIASRIDALGLREHVDLLGEINEMAGFYQGLDAFCLSSISEGFPNVLCEAMGHGLPVVTTAAGDAKEIVGDAGAVVPVGDRLQLVGALRHLASLTRTQRQEIGAISAQSVRKKYDIERVSREYFTKYLNLMGL